MALSMALLMVLLMALLTLLSSFNLALAAKLPERLTFKNIVENKDFSIGEGTAFLQDSEGYMWLGGSLALMRYDGYEFRQFEFAPDPNKPNEKRSPEFIYHIFEDSHHTIWIATRSGLLRYYPRSDKLIKVKDDETQKVRISITETFRVVEMPSGEIVVGSLAGLFVIDPLSNKYQVITSNPPKANQQNWLHNQHVLSAWLTPDGQLWLGTDEGVERVNWKEKKFTRVLFNPNPSDPKLQESVVVVRDITAQRDGTLWFGTLNGVVHYDPRTHHAKRYSHRPDDRTSLGGNQVWKLLVDSRNLLWVASDGGGLAVFDRANDSFVNHQAEPGRAGGLNTSTVRTVFEDTSGDIWVGTFPSGVHFYDRSTEAITTYTANAANPNSLSVQYVLSTKEDKQGNLWLGTDGGGLSYFDREKNTFTHFKHNPKDPNSLNGDAVLTTLIDSKGIIWIGTWGQGLASYNPAQKKFTRYPFFTDHSKRGHGLISAALNDETVWSIKEDKNHDLWIGTHNSGISKLNPQTGLFTQYMPVANDPTSLSGHLIWQSLEDAQGNLWVATASGLNLMNKDRTRFTRFMADPTNPGALSHSNVFSIFEDSKKRLWFGTSSGLNLYHPKTNTFTAYTKRHGFFNDTIHDVVEDRDGLFWVSTTNGFSSFHPETHKIKNYTRLGGRLVGGFAIHSGTLSRHGEVIFGGVEGLRIINPHALPENKRVPPVVLTDFKIFSDSIVPGGSDGMLSQVINHTASITLDHNKTMFAFSFAALNFKDPEKNQYAYKLEGFDREWITIANLRGAKYTNLDPGKYVFKVKASNNDGIWNEAGKSITIIQLAPPWKTWWAYTLYSLSILASIALFTHSKRKKRHLIRIQNRLYSEALEAKVKQRTQELEDSNANLATALEHVHTAQAELARVERMAALGFMVAGVAHELNTPLGNCLMMVSTLKEETQRLSQALAEGSMRRSDLTDYTEMSLSASDLLQRGLQQSARLVANFKQMAVDQSSAQRKTFNLQTLLQELQTLLDASASTTPITLELAIPADIELDSYPAQLEKVLLNLADNAIIHGLDGLGGLNEGIMRCHAQQQGHKVCIVFEDNGKGMPPEILKRIFEPFFSTTFGQGGSGLGLSIAFNLVTNVLGGEIHASSTIGQGTRFEITIPLVAPMPP